MGISIFFDKQFIRLSDNTFIPMLYAGSSNWYDAGSNGRNGRRSRDWGNQTFHTGGKISATASEILASIETEKVNRYERAIESSKSFNEAEPTLASVEKSYGYWLGLSIGGSSTSKTTYGMYKGFYTTGMKQAMTVEELVAKNIIVHAHIYHWDAKELEAAGLSPVSEYPKTTQELMDLIAEYEIKTAGTQYSLSINIDADERKMKRLRADRIAMKPRLAKPKKEITEKFIFLVDGYGAYFYKGTKNGFKYTTNQYAAQCKYTLKDAEKRLAELNKKHTVSFTIETLQLRVPQLV